MFALVNRLQTKPGERDAVVENLLESGKAFDGNDACLLYLVTESVDEPDTIWVVDLWTSEEAHTDALQDPRLRPFIEATMPLLQAPPEQIELRHRGGIVSLASLD
jgi:quinol monooxygenase YgiN